ncbi:YlqD family protein [Caldalkalibacillus salinus]|uniref:YlqD family protein n=1 Tax=Caldalkalibacillus salinus TaxID=2803787 RepID=UPI0019207DA6|nr:YlqD family protein [Caldalkalibacillus salinus]
MKIIRPVQVKVVLTQQSKQELQEEYQNQLNQLKLEMEQLRFQGKKILHESKKNPDYIRQMQEKLKQEEQKKQENIEKVEFQLEQLSMVSIGTEILHSTVDSEVEVKVGDVWEDLMKGAEIIIKDGIVHEIRESREDHDKVL